MVGHSAMALLSVAFFTALWCHVPATALLYSSAVKLKNSSESLGACTPLRDRGSHFTAEIHVGMPSQKFDVIADTGSDALIVASCACRVRQKCFPRSKCFTGKSSSFSVSNSEEPSTVMLSYGSGQIKAAPATDIVTVGNVRATMNGSLLLMIDHQLNIVGPFEGLLGLGLPKDDSWTDEPGQMRFPGFLQAARVGRFSICVNSHSGGALHLHEAPDKNPLGSIGKHHWGFDFRGVSVGTKQSSFCLADSMNPEQVSPCGAIPDSGTTMIMGPGAQLIEVFSSICDSWPRCNQSAEQSEDDKHEMFLNLLSERENWASPKRELHEFPPLHFHVVGSAGNRETLKISAEAYVLKVVQEDVEFLGNDLPHRFAAKKLREARATRHVCVPAFGQFEYPTRMNGPVWILGLPLFHEYQVGYDLDANPPAVSFSNESCGECDLDGEMFLSIDRQNDMSSQPRRLTAPPRMPSVSTHGSLGISRAELSWHSL